MNKYIGFMDNYIKTMALLEEKIILLLNKLKENHLNIERLVKANEDLINIEHKLKIKITNLENQNHSLVIASNLSGTSENKTLARQKINKLIKEVDSCISKLSEVKNEEAL